MMALGLITSDATALRRSNASLGATSTWSMALWFNHAAISSARYEHIFDLNNNAGSGNADAEKFHFDPSTNNVWYFADDAAQVQQLFTATPTSWYFFGVTSSGSSKNAYWRLSTANALTSTSFTGSSSTTITAIDIGRGHLASEWLNGSIGCAKFWDGAALSSTEMLVESYQNAPRRMSNLGGWWPFMYDPIGDRTDPNDYSGNGLHLASGTGPAQFANNGLQFRGGHPKTRKLLVAA